MNVMRTLIKDFEVLRTIVGEQFPLIKCGWTVIDVFSLRGGRLGGLEG